MTKASASSADLRFGAKPPSSPTLVLWPASFSAFFSVWNISAPMRTASANVSAPDRHDHEFLEIDRIVGMHAAIDDVHHRHRQEPRAGSADIAVERQPVGVGRRLRHGQRDAEDGIGAEPALVLRAVELDQRLVDMDLVFRLHAADGVEDLAVHRFDRLQHALAEEALLVAVAQLHRLMRAGRGAGRHGGAAEGAVLQGHVDLHRRIAAAVEDLPADDVDDGGHARSFAWRAETYSKFARCGSGGSQLHGDEPRAHRSCHMLGRNLAEIGSFREAGTGNRLATFRPCPERRSTRQCVIH